MTVHTFRGIPDLQEVECSGGHLDSEVNILALKLVEESNSSVLAYANPMKKECLTFGEFSSCFLDTTDTRKSRLRILVSDLAVGQTRMYGCVVSSWKSLGVTETLKWSVAVTGQRKSQQHYSYIALLTYVTFAMKLTFK